MSASIAASQDSGVEQEDVLKNGSKNIVRAATSRLAIAANFTAELIEQSLRFWIDFHHWHQDVAFAPYDQIFQELLAPNSLFSNNAGGSNIILLRFDAWLADIESSGTTTADENLQLFVHSLLDAASRTSAHFLVCLCPASAELNRSQTASSWICAAQNHLLSTVADKPGITCIRPEDILALYPVQKIDEPQADALGAIPYTNDFFAALGTYLARRIHQLKSSPYKVIALDCDNTLWKGIVGEDGPTGIQITPECRELQSFVVRQLETGMLVCLCSKNNEADVWEAFDTHPEMPLRREHIIAHRISWAPKSAGLRALSEELSLGLDSFIFLDDSPMECAEVRESIPEILTLQLPETKVGEFLRHVWAFDRARTTKEDRQRTAMYRQNLQRERQRSEVSSLTEFLHALQLEVSIKPLTTERIGRVADLTQRTNQFNATTIRRSAAEISAMLVGGELRCVTVDVRDRFGDYGLVGVIIYQFERSAIAVDTMLLSCRALGRGVEHRMLAELGRIARENQLARVEIPFKPTRKNAPIHEFLESIGSEFREPESDGVRYCFPTDFASDALEKLPNQAERIDAADRRRDVPSTGDFAARAANLARIATELRSPADVLKRIAARHLRRRGDKGFVAPATDLEQRVAAIWSSILFLDRVGRTDNFFELGGQSLQAALMLARVQEMTAAPLKLAMLFETPALAEFVELIDRAQLSSRTEQTIIRRSVVENRAPLSPIQQRFWMMDRFVTSKAVYNVNTAFRIRGPLDVTAFRAAWLAVLQRQEALRTIFQEMESAAWQVILPMVPGDVRYHDLRSHPEELEARIHAEAALPFDLGIAPLWRASLDQIADREFVFHISIHHILMDESSREILMRDLWQAYSQLTAGGTAQLPALSMRYTDFSIWQREHLQESNVAQHLQYWKQKLAGTGVDLLPPYLKSRPSQRSYSGDFCRFSLANELRDKLADLARNSGVTPFIVYLAAFQTLLARYANQTDICIGTAISNRPATSCSDILGCFVNTVAIRGNLSGEPTLRQLLHRLRDEMKEVMQHDEIPIEKIIEEVLPERIPGGHPLFQSVFIYNSENLSGTLPGGLKWELEPMAHVGAKLDFGLSIEDGPGHIAVGIEYSTDLYDRESIERIGAHYLTLLEAIAASPDSCILELPILPQAERKQIVETWNSNRTQLPRDRCVHQLVEDQVARTPEATAFEFAGKAMTFRQWNEQANQLARFLREQGVGPDVPVALCLERSLFIPLALLGVVKAGGAYAPFDPSQPGDRLEYMIADTGSPVILTTKAHRDRLSKSQCPVVCLDELLPKLSNYDTQNLPCASTPENLFAIIYTSGSTGKPKGVMLHHRGIVNLMFAVRDVWEISRSDVLIALIPYTFDPHIKEFWGFAIQGARVIIAPQEITTDGGKLLNLMNQVRPTVFNGTPTILRLLAEAGWNGTPGLKVLSGGEAMTVESVKQNLPKVGKFWNVYGPTECSVTSLSHRIIDSNKAPPVGRPLPNVQIYILNPHMQPVPIGCPGEIHIGGVGVTRGYLHQPQLTTEKFVPNPFDAGEFPRLYKTGDLGRYLPDGNIEFLGRIDFQVKIRGFRIELGEVERTLESHPQVEQAVVIVRRNTVGIDALVGYFIPKPNVAPKPAQLRSWLLGKLPDYMVPSAFVAMQSFPETTNRKVDRKALPQPDAMSDAATQRVHAAPANDAERAIQPIWEEAFGIKPIGVTENFYDLGGHSVVAALLMSRIETRLGHQLPLEALFQAPTIRGLGNAIQTKLELGKGGVLVPLQTTGDHPPLFLIAGAGGHVFAFHKFAHMLGPEFNVYGMKAIGVDGTEPPLESIVEIARRYKEEILEAVPDGPYLVSGYSVGGMIAYELALQLQAAGKKVSGVLLFDLFAPGYPKRQPLYKRIYSHTRKFLGLSWAKKWSYIRARLSRIRQRILFKLDRHHELAEVPGMDIVPQERLKRVWGGLVKALQNYWPSRAFDGRIVLVASSLPLEWVGVDLDDPVRGWSQWTTKPVKLYHVPAPHMELFRDEYVDLLLSHVREVLRAAKAELEP